MNRPRKNAPPGIDLKKLPDGIWFDPSGRGRWMIRYKDANGERRSRRLCRADATISEIWHVYTKALEVKSDTFEKLSAEFQKSPTWNELKRRTKLTYLACHRVICNQQTSASRFGDVPLSSWGPGLVRRYRDHRGQTSRSRANIEMRYIARVFAWAYEYELVKTNPARGIRALKVSPRQHYVEDGDYQFVLEMASESRSPYLAPMMELAYLCRMRRSEVLALADANELQDGVLVSRLKGSKNNITRWTPRLRAAWEQAKHLRSKKMAKGRIPMPLNQEHRYLFIGHHGGQLQEKTFDSAWQRLMNAAVRKGLESRFTMHDLKRKGVSDTSGDKLEASGHRNPAMLKIYDVSVPVVDPAGGELAGDWQDP